MRGLLALVAAGLLVGSIMPAQAEDWCGFHQKANSRVRCGFTSLAQCKDAFHHKPKNVTCRLDPSFAQIHSWPANG